jgi:hypothetical protein
VVIGLSEKYVLLIFYSQKIVCNHNNKISKTIFMIQLPNFVFSHLIEKNHIGKTRTLIVGENYPGENYASSYFYRSIPTCPGGPAIGAASAFFTNLCNVLLIPNTIHPGVILTEYERLNKFLDSGFLLIDAQKNLEPAIRPANLTPNEISNLIRTILFINPKNIMFLTNNNIPVINLLSAHHLFPSIADKIMTNHLTGTQVFAFPSPPANPNHFVNQINHARNYYFI